ncbi:hypothetical protein SAMN05660199_03774 [Klenkia soli]|uniref:Uncharacterized protein n=1 Tax=Klenkia soli TaxID=1052260 RepID=A0A1H0SDR1_9ACTN|nr:hypothetical protein [Klenkia soli]SDP39316.1 hypothetical protein SAMN05660199_03774 [Klenkia soli]
MPPLPLRRPLLLSGPPSVGLTSVAGALVAARELCAAVDVADVRGLVRSGAVQPWRPGAGEDLHRLAAVQAGLLAASFTAAGVEVVLCDVVRGQVGEVYRTSTAAPFVVALRAPLEVVRARAAASPLTGPELEALHAENAAVREVDAEVDATAALPAVVAAVERLWAAAGTATPTA